MKQKKTISPKLRLIFLFAMLIICILLFLITAKPFSKQTETPSKDATTSQSTEGKEPTMQEVPEPIQEDADANTDVILSDQDSSRVTYKPEFYYEALSEDVKKRTYGLSYKKDCTVPYEELRYVSVLYTDFEGKTQVGEIICNKSIAQAFLEIFYELYQASYPIEQIRLVDEYNADDTLSCLDNNSSCFNFRVVEGSDTLSNHALGLAIDINPFYNPYVTYPNDIKTVTPVGSEAYADRSKDFAYKIDEDDLCYQLFDKYGFKWGGHWKSVQDYQHFEMPTEK